MTKLKVDYLSDPHLNHHVLFSKNQEKWKSRTENYAKDTYLLDDESRGDVLVLAGDYSEFNQQTKWFIDFFTTYYTYIFVVFGNHDYYLLSKNQINKYKYNSHNRVEEIIDYYSSHPIVHTLDNDEFTVIKENQEFKFAGTTLWYDEPRTEAGAQFYKTQSNDSALIFTQRLLGQSGANARHERDKEFYESLDEVDVMITHIPPLHPKASPFSYNECYTTPVDVLKARYWIAGHQHVETEFEKAGTKFFLNPSGYPSDSYTSKRMKQFEVEI